MMNNDKAHVHQMCPLNSFESDKNKVDEQPSYSEYVYCMEKHVKTKKKKSCTAYIYT